MKPAARPHLLWRKQKDFDGQVLKITETVENEYKLSTNYQASAFLRRLFFVIFTWLFAMRSLEQTDAFAIGLFAVFSTAFSD